MKTKFVSLRVLSVLPTLLLGMALGLSAMAAPKKVLVVTTTTGFRHSSIETAEKILAELGQKSGAFTVDYARVSPNDPQYKGDDGKTDTNKVFQAIKQVLAEKMSPEALKNYDGVIFANTTGTLPLPDEQAFLNWIKSGKAFIGMHSATDTFRGHTPLDPYVEMIGAEFKHHGQQAEVECINDDPKHPADKPLPPQWHAKDEIYLMNGFEKSKVHSLLHLDKHPNDKTEGFFPIAWCKEYGESRRIRTEHGSGMLMLREWRTRPGRVFYTSLGHREDMWDPNTPAGFKRENSKENAELYQKHILGGIKWALGLEKGSAKP